VYKYIYNSTVYVVRAWNSSAYTRNPRRGHFSEVSPLSICTSCHQLVIRRLNLVNTSRSIRRYIIRRLVKKKFVRARPRQCSYKIVFPFAPPACVLSARNDRDLRRSTRRPSAFIYNKGVFEIPF